MKCSDWVAIRCLIFGEWSDRRALSGYNIFPELVILSCSLLASPRTEDNVEKVERQEQSGVLAVPFTLALESLQLTALGSDVWRCGPGSCKG